MDTNNTRKQMKKKDLKLEAQRLAKAVENSTSLLEEADQVISDLQAEVGEYKVAYKKVVEENINLVNQMDACLKEKLADRVKEVNPLDVIDSLAIKSLVELDKSGVVYGLDGVALLSELRAEFKEIRQEKGLE